MAALIESTAFSRLPEADGRDYVRRCVRRHQPFGVITGSGPARNALVVSIAADCRAHEHLHTARIAVPTHTAEAFLASLLAQLGLEQFEATLDDLQGLMVAFLRHESARGRRTIAILERADHCGLPVFEIMRALSQVRAGATPPITFILTGSSELLRILDSSALSGLQQFTRQRFDRNQGLVSARTPPAVAVHSLT